MKSVFIGALLTLMAWPLAAQYNVSGTVSDKATGEPIPFANILIEETKADLQAGAEGNYVFEGLPQASTPWWRALWATQRCVRR